MPTFVTIGDVQARNPHRKIESAGTSPNVAQVTEWLDTAEGILTNTLASVGIALPTAGTAGAKILKDLLADYGEGHVRKAYAAAGGDGNNDDGKDLLEGWKEALKDIRENPGDWAAMLGGTTSPGVGRRLRGPASTDVSDPIFTMERPVS